MDVVYRVQVFLVTPLSHPESKKDALYLFALLQLALFREEARGHGRPRAQRIARDIFFTSLALFLFFVDVWVTAERYFDGSIDDKEAWTLLFFFSTKFFAVWECFLPRSGEKTPEEMLAFCTVSGLIAFARFVFLFARRQWAECAFVGVITTLWSWIGWTAAAVQLHGV